MYCGLPYFYYFCKASCLSAGGTLYLGGTPLEIAGKNENLTDIKANNQYAMGAHCRAVIAAQRKKAETDTPTVLGMKQWPCRLIATT